MSSTFSSNRVIVKIELCECLMRDQVVMFDIKGRVVVTLLCCVVMLEQDVEHLQLQPCYRKD